MKEKKFHFKWNLFLHKRLESQQKFDTLISGYTILDYAPKGVKNSGFGALALESKSGEIVVALRGTQLSDFGDLVADINLVLKKVPEKQSRDMIDFLEKLFQTLPKNKKIKIVGHSLGGALTQIATAMYGEKVSESMTFNSPGAKDFKINLNANDPYFIPFQKFMNQKDTEGTAELITNVKGESGVSLIADLGTDIGNYEIKLKGLSSHSIVTTFEYLDTLDEDSEELIPQHVNKKEKQKKQIIYSK